MFWNMWSKPLKNICGEVHLKSSYTVEAYKFTEIELLHKYFLGILTTDSSGNFAAILKKFLKMATAISKNTFFSKIPPVAASVNTQN